MLVACGGSSSSDNTSDVESNLSDVDDSENSVLESVSENGGLVGITAELTPIEPETRYALSESADGRFQINETTGVVAIADFTRINYLNHISHSITVEAKKANGKVLTQTFDIAIHQMFDNFFPPISRLSFLDWNSGSEHNLVGWNWLFDVAYGNPGWILSENGTEKLGPGQRFSWGDGPRIFNKGDYGTGNDVMFVLDDLAPTTGSGAALRIFDPENTDDNRSTWWIWYDGVPLVDRQITNQNTDRMDFYLKLEGVEPIDDSGEKESIKGDNFHVGTYLCWEGETPSFGTGEGCPYEGPGNQHFYHYLTLNSGAWIHVQLDQHPQHKRNIGNAGNNPPFEKAGRNYFAQLSRMYFEIRYPQLEKTAYTLDEIGFFSSSMEVEPDQNEESITSLWVGYWPEEAYWEMGFHDESFDVLRDGSYSTFEVRWSTKPITNGNFSEANLVEPELYSGAKYTGSDETHYLRRANDRATNVWTRFSLPSEVVDNYAHIYFAVKDVSVEGGNAGTEWPWTRPDGHDSVSSFIKTIDYALPKQ